MNPVVAQVAERIIERTFMGMNKNQQGMVLVCASFALFIYGINRINS